MDRLDDDERLPPDRFGDVRQGRQPEVPADGGQLVRQLVAGQLGPGVQDLPVSLDRPPEDACVGLADGDQPELECGDDPEAAAAAAERPEELGLVFAVGADESSVGGHELDRVDVACGESVLAAEPAETAAEGVADDADIGRGTGERGEAVLCSGLDELD